MVNLWLQEKKEAGNKEEEEKKKKEEVKEEKKEEEKKDEKPQEIVLKVDMHCEACARKVAKALKGFEGPFNFSIEIYKLSIEICVVGYSKIIATCSFF